MEYFLSFLHDYIKKGENMPSLKQTIAQKIIKCHKSRSGKTIFSNKQIGYIIAGIVDDDVAIGYSLCHRQDKYDFVDGVRTAGFGKHLAVNRAIKWNKKEHIEVPPSIKLLMEKFIIRCSRYYKGKDMPNIFYQGTITGHSSEEEIHSNFSGDV